LEYLKRFDPEDPRKATPSYHGSTEHFDIERANAELVAPRFGTQAHRLLTWFYDNPDGETDWLLSVKLGMLHTSLGSVRNALTYGDKRTGRGGGWLEAVRDESGAVVQRPSGNGDGKGIVWAMTAPARSVWPRYAT
jgi:hypothetical protein